MQFTKSTNSVLSKHLLTTLDLFKTGDEIIGPRGDNYHHFQEVHIIKGDDDYSITAVTSVDENSIISQATKLGNAPTRFRGMSGVCLVFWSEAGYMWTRSLFFHKGLIFQEDYIVDSNFDLYPGEEDAAQ